MFAGGAKDEFGDFYYKPTILTDLTPEMEISREEIFGPVTAITKFKTEEVIQAKLCHFTDSKNKNC
jgi:succinate-semialdehyde dehydrogenase/glutarate-semialdehyde dehydrogenase